MNWDFLQFVKESNGHYSSVRLLSFLVVLSFIVDWQKCIWSNLVFEPSLTLISFVVSIVGLKTIQKKFEDGGGDGPVA